jgi:hypothetical protein
MTNRSGLAAAFVAALSCLPTAPAEAAGIIVITQAKALAGNVTPYDAPGFPISLTLAGTTYQLAEDIKVNKTAPFGIAVHAHDITIDMNGFRLTGDYKGSVGIFGVPDISHSVTVKNGTIAHFNADGILATESEYWVLDGLRIIVNARNGVDGQDDWIIRNSQIGRNRGRGIMLGDNANIHNNIITRNESHGLVCDTSCHVADNNISENKDRGAHINTGTALGNTISENTSYGLQAVTVGIGNNVFYGNNGNFGDEIYGNVHPLQPNYCQDCPP